MRSIFSLAAAGCTLCLAACIAVVGAGKDDHEHDHHAGGQATSRIHAKSGSSLSGFATFTEKAGGVEVVVTVSGVTPGWHAVHIHEMGDCSADDGTSAGGHFNPGGHDHGAPHAAERHAGDLGNMWVDDDGNGYHVVFMPELTVDRGAFGVIGRSIIVHEKADDLVSQPTGAAGGRIGCGEIR